MPINLEHPPFRLTCHRRTTSRQTLDTVLENLVSSTTSSRPSTASSESSFSTAYTTLEAGSCFRYYLPHISTPTSSVYTRSEGYACNRSLLTPDRNLPPVHFGQFYHYIPTESTEQDDVYTNGLDIIVDAPRGKGRVQVASEPKVLGGLNDFVTTEPPTPTEVTSPLSVVGPHDFPYWPVTHVAEEVNINAGSYAAGEVLNGYQTTVLAGEGETKKQRNKLTKEKDKRSEAMADVSAKVKKMLRKLHIGKKPLE